MASTLCYVWLPTVVEAAGRPAFASRLPDRFGSLADARAFPVAFIPITTMSTGTGASTLHTPAWVRHATADEIRSSEPRPR